MGRLVTVLGSGVSGLSVALVLQERGFQVRIRSAETAAHTTSAVAAAIWHPFYQSPDSAYLRRAVATYERLTAMTGAAGVHGRTLTEYFRGDDGVPWWIEAVPGARRVPAAELPAEYGSAFAMPVPIADTTRYLSHLTEAFVATGGRFERAFVTDLRDAADRADWVVNCTGFGSASLAGDPDLVAVRGLVLRCAKVPGLTGCWIDDTDPRRPTYVIERADDLVLGGFVEPSLLSTAVEAEAVDDILARCARLVPAVAGARVLQTRVGFRPARASVRVGIDPDLTNVVHNYGHGGSGFTLSWGCADDVAALIATA